MWNGWKRLHGGTNTNIDAFRLQQFSNQTKNTRTLTLEDRYFRQHKFFGMLKGKRRIFTSHAPQPMLRQLNLFSLECRRIRADLILAFKIFKGEVDLYPSEFFLCPLRAGLRGHTYRLLQGPSRLRRRSGAFSVRVVKYWNRFPAHLVLSPSVSIFKKQFYRQWSEILPAAPV